MAKFDKDNAKEMGAKGGKKSKRKTFDKRVQEFLESVVMINKGKKEIDTGKTKEDMLLEALYRSCLKGNVYAGREIFDRGFGKARQGIDLKADPDSEYQELLKEIQAGKIKNPTDTFVPNLSTAGKNKEFDFTAVDKKKKVKLKSSKNLDKKPKKKVKLRKERKK
jgi:hypothetical protein